MTWWRLTVSMHYTWMTSRLHTCLLASYFDLLRTCCAVENFDRTSTELLPWIFNDIFVVRILWWRCSCESQERNIKFTFIKNTAWSFFITSSSSSSLQMWEDVVVDFFSVSWTSSWNSKSLGLRPTRHHRIADINNNIFFGIFWDLSHCSRLHE